MKTQFNPENKALTYGDCLKPAMEITDESDAKQYLADYVAHIQTFLDKEPNSEGLTAEQIAKINLGYFAGYYDNATRERVERLFCCSHPIFGSIANGAPTMEEAFKAGKRMGGVCFMKTKITIAFLVLWLAAPNRVANAETPPEPDKMTLPTLFVAGCVVAVVGAGAWVAVKLRKRYGGTNGLFSPQRRFGTNLLSALTDTNASMAVISGELQDVPYLLSLATATNQSGRYHLETSSDMVSWTEIGRYRDEDWIAVAPANGRAGYFRVRVE